MIAAAVVGAIFGLGVYALVRALVPSRPGLGAAVAQVDALRARSGSSPLAPPAPVTGTDRIRAALGVRVADFYVRQGWTQRSVRADLAVLDRSWEGFLATKVGLAAAGLVFGPALFAVLWLIGIQLTLTIPLWLALIFAGVFFLLPDLEVRRDATAKRRDFRRVVGAYLDLVAMNLAGGRGLPEALMAAADVSDGWALARIRRCLTDARITGTTQWAALGQLGEDLAIDELKDLASALGLVADDGAKIRASLASRAETLRHRELSEVEGQAGARSQSMLVAQMLLCTGFLVFLTFPAAMRVFEL
ncbi:MAG: putative integral rane protein [Actinomycetia bacterium]|nr:putative integral rane protein [Actinomycetes bacterium]